MGKAATGGALETYRAKRRFNETSEPRGKDAAGKPGAAYLIQKHDATRLHYDFRLELDGVLLSWAVTRGPSYNTKDRRLAVRTEDHPLEYGGFEGTIPKGNYGGGTVMLWDTGTWEPVGDPREGLKKGKLVFLLYGKRLVGRWGLIRMKPHEKERNENWLLIKEVDEYANTNPDLLEEKITSVVSERGLDEIAAADVPKRRAQKLPAFVPPMLATLVEDPPGGADWLFEIKFDGYRAQIAANGDDVRIYTRSGLDWSDKFPQIVQAARALNCDGALLDGEIVVLDGEGRSDFGALVGALESGKGQMHCFGFDLLALGGASLTAQPLTARKAALKTLLKNAAKSRIQYSEEFSASAKNAGAKMLQTACARGLEGIIAKRRDLPYRGGRHGGWQKIKCRHEQEFLILGFAASGRGRLFSSLLLGVREGRKITYAGRVGTGFNEDTLTRLAALRDANVVEKPPAEGIPKLMQRGVTWVKPVLVANIAFAGWTPDKNIRHGSFLGLREDKNPDEVVREMPVAKPKTADESAEVDGVRISHAGKIVYEAPPVSKIEIANYIDLAGKLMLPYAAGRFITLVRAPSGPGAKTFYQRHPHAGFGEAWLHQTFKDEQYIYFEKTEALVAAVQMNVLEFHIWGSRVDDIDRPDRIVFDLDPDPGVDFATVKAAALRVRDVLEALGLTSLPLLSGGKGVHVVVPVQRKYPWPVIKEFSNKLSYRIAADAPDQFVATMSKAKRVNKIFIDHFRNEKGSTAIAPFSPRARPGAAVAWPVDWAGLARAPAANFMTIAAAAAAITAGEDGWAGYGKIKQSLSVGALRALDVAF
jgi:bifunctional non-homologous end joining protein LigD